MVWSHQDAVEAAQNRQRKDNFAVLARLVVAPEQVGDRPYERGVILDYFRRGGYQFVLAFLKPRGLFRGYQYEATDSQARVHSGCMKKARSVTCGSRRSGFDGATANIARHPTRWTRPKQPDRPSRPRDSELLRASGALASTRLIARF